jgi:hypothetical protein
MRSARVAIDPNRRGREPAIRRFTKPIWVGLRLRMLLWWLPGPLLQWIRYLLYYGKALPLGRPRTLTERLLVKMARDRRPLLTRTADRVAMRQYVEERVGPGHLPELLAVLARPEEVLALALPEQYVAKATHGSQMVHIVRHDGPSERALIAQKGRRWLRTEYWRRHGEWAYRDIPKRVIIEGFLGGPDDPPPDDWKFYCIGGSVAVSCIDFDRFVNHRRNFYDREGHQLDLALNHRYGPGDLRPVPPEYFPMREMAERLAEGFDFLRVDLFNLSTGIVVGELTHYPAAGLLVFDPPDWDRTLGDRWGASSA